MRFGEWNKKIVFPVFYNNIYQVLKFSFPMKYFTLSVNNIFLQIKCNVFGNTKILHCIRNDCTKFSTNPEEVIYPCLAGEDDRSKVKYINFLLTEIF